MYQNIDKFNCDECSHHHCDESGVMPGSNGAAGFPKWYIKEIGEFNTCLLPMVSDESLFYIRMYKHYKNGILIKSGGLLEQPHCYLKAMELIDSCQQQIA